MAVIVETLVVDEHRVAHVARHDITVDEVREVVSGDYVYIQGHVSSQKTGGCYDVFQDIPKLRSCARA